MWSPNRRQVRGHPGQSACGRTLSSILPHVFSPRHPQGLVFGRGADWLPQEPIVGTGVSEIPLQQLNVDCSLVQRGKNMLTYTKVLATRTRASSTYRYTLYMSCISSDTIRDTHPLALTCEANVLVFYSLHVEPDGGNSRHHLPELELVQDSGFTGRVQTHLFSASCHNKSKSKSQNSSKRPTGRQKQVCKWWNGRYRTQLTRVLCMHTDITPNGSQSQQEFKTRHDGRMTKGRSGIGIAESYANNMNVFTIYTDEMHRTKKKNVRTSLRNHVLPVCTYQVPGTKTADGAYYDAESKQPQVTSRTQASGDA